MVKHAELFWGMIASMWISNLMLVILNLPLVGLWVKLLQVPYRLLYTSIILFWCISVYSINSAVFDVYLTIAFGILGYILIKLEFEPAPLLLGVILGPLMEENLRRAMLRSRGSLSVFWEKPLSLGLLLTASSDGHARDRDEPCRTAGRAGRRCRSGPSAGRPRSAGTGLPGDASAEGREVFAQLRPA